MRAILYEKNNPNQPLVLREINQPQPGPEEILVKIHKASINAADYRSMKLKIIPKSKIFGADIAGRIESCGSKVTKFAVGDRVFGDISEWGFGGFAEYVVVHEKCLAKIPEDVSFSNAAAVPMAAVTALQGMRDKGHITKGMKVLVHGSGGGVGTFAVQLSKHFGATVTALCGPKNIELMNQLHADHVIDYTKEDFALSNNRYDLTLGVHGNQRLRKYQRALSSHGVFVMVGGNLSQVLKAVLFGWAYSLGKKKIRFLATKPNVEDLEYVIKLVSTGEIKPVIERTYPLDRTPHAMQYTGSGHAKGKILIEIDPSE